MNYIYLDGNQATMPSENYLSWRIPPYYFKDYDSLKKYVNDVFSETIFLTSYQSYFYSPIDGNYHLGSHLINGQKTKFILCVGVDPNGQNISTMGSITITY